MNIAALAISVAAFMNHAGFAVPPPAVQVGLPDAAYQGPLRHPAAAALPDGRIAIDREWLAEQEDALSVATVLLHEEGHEVGGAAAWETLTPEQQTWDEAAAESVMRDVLPAYAYRSTGIAWTYAEVGGGNAYDPLVRWMRGVSAIRCGCSWKRYGARRWRADFLRAPVSVRATMLAGMPPVPAVVDSG